MKSVSQDNTFRVRKVGSVCKGTQFSKALRQKHALEGYATCLHTASKMSSYYSVFGHFPPSHNLQPPRHTVQSSQMLQPTPISQGLQETFIFTVTCRKLEAEVNTGVFYEEPQPTD